MTNGPRVVYLTMPATDPVRHARWVGHGRQLIGMGPEGLSLIQADGSAGFVVWHLVSANHRTLARGADLYPDRPTAERAVKSLSTSAPALKIHLVSRRQPGVYGWYATHAGAPILTCARWYESERTRRESIELALAALARLGEPEVPAAGMFDLAT